MDKKQLIIDLKEKFNISTSNAYPKKSYLDSQEVAHVGLFGTELDMQPFYFVNTYNGKYYKIEDLNKDNLKTEEFQSSIKYQVPMYLCEELGVAKEEFKEVEDENISHLTILDLYSIIQNVPESGKNWLNKIIRRNSTRS